MAGKWEMCIFNTPVLFFCSPGQKRRNMSEDEYMVSRGSRFNAMEMTAYDVIPYLLDDGWEPFALETNNFYFRRKYPG
jgi:hypothetical protein